MIALFIKLRNMKKIKLLLFLLPIISFGQDNFNDYNQIIKEIELSTAKKDDKKKKKVHRLEIGLNGGVNFAEIAQIPKNGIEPQDLSNKLGALYGGTIVYNFNRFLCIKGDFDIASKGFEYSNVNFIKDDDAFQTIKTGDIKQMLNYFDVPAFFHLGFGKKLKFDINFGPYMAFLLKNRSNLIDQNGNKVTLDDNAKEFAIENLDQIDWGWVGGAGIDYHLTEKISIGFDFLLEQGQKLLNGGSTFGDFKNKSLDFDFGVNFMLFEKKSKKPF
jgi:hypothetical protein